MKFKTIFWIFNTIILISFLFIFLLPLPVLGWESAVIFWRDNWYFAFLFIGVLVLLDFYFLSHWRLYVLLEGEDWKALYDHLKDQILVKHRYHSQSLRIFVNASLLTSQIQGLKDVRQHLQQFKGKLALKYGVNLGLPEILEGEGDKIMEYFSPLQGTKGVNDPQWASWCVAFAHVVKKDYEGAKEILLSLVGQKEEPLVRLLALYLLAPFVTVDPELGRILPQLRGEMLKAYTPRDWQKVVETRKEQVVLIIFLGKMIGEALDWLRKEENYENHRE